MPDTVKRGFVPSDEDEFVKQIDKLRRAGEDLYYLINRGYPLKNASVFTGNHFLLSERQRLALVRSVSAESRIAERKKKELECLPEGADVYIDCFNTVISLETAFSGSTLLLCMDGAVRDLAGLRGTYRIIDKTEPAVTAVKNVLEKEKAGTAHFLIDAPVSNSGRLRAFIESIFTGSAVKAEFEVINNVDKALYDRENVVSSDAVILDRCVSWFNLVKRAVAAEIGEYPYVTL